MHSTQVLCDGGTTRSQGILGKIDIQARSSEPLRQKLIPRFNNEDTYLERGQATQKLCSNEETSIV